MSGRIKPLRILVTGGAGFIGSHTVDALVRAGHRVRILDALVRPNHNGHKPAYLNPRAEFMLGNVCDKADWLRALRNIDAVFHFAAYMDYLPDFSKFYRVNTAGTALLYEVAVERKLPLRKVVLASSQAVYGEGRYRCALHGDVFPGQRSLEDLRSGRWEYRCSRCSRTLALARTRESDPLNAHNSYGLSKIAMESMAFRLGARYGLPTVCLRYSIVQGARQSPRNFYSGALRIFVLQALAGLPLTVYEDGLARRDFVNVHDVVDANLTVLLDWRANQQAFNVGGGRTLTVTEFGRRVRQIVNPASAPLITGEFRFGDTRHIYSDTAKLRRLGWKTRRTALDSIREYADWLCRQPLLRTLVSRAADDMRRKGVLLKTGGTDERDDDSRRCDEPDGPLTGS